MTAGSAGIGVLLDIDPLRALLHEAQPFNMTSAVEQVAYFLLLRSLSEGDAVMRELDRSYASPFGGGDRASSWSDVFHAHDADLVDVARHAISMLHTLPLLGKSVASALRGARLTIANRAVIRSIVDFIGELDLSDPDAERVFFNRLTDQITRVETPFRTPRHIAELLVALLEPRFGQRVCDPVCGAGSLIVDAFREMTVAQQPATPDWRWLESDAFTAYDDDPMSMRLAALNFYVNRLAPARLSVTPKRRDTELRFDIIVADLTAPDAVRRLYWIFEHLGDGGRAGVIVPRDTIADGGSAVDALHQHLFGSCIEAFITLPKHAFDPYSSMDMALILFSRRAPQRQVWAFMVRADGYSLDARRLPVRQNDLPALLEQWRRRDDDGSQYIELEMLVGKSSVVLEDERLRKPPTWLEEIAEAQCEIVKLLSTRSFQYVDSQADYPDSSDLASSAAPDGGLSVCTDDDRLQFDVRDIVAACASAGIALSTEQPRESASCVFSNGDVPRSDRGTLAKATVLNYCAALGCGSDGVGPSQREQQFLSKYIGTFLNAAIRPGPVRTRRTSDVELGSSMRVPSLNLARQRALVEQLGCLDQAVVLGRRTLEYATLLIDAVYDSWQASRRSTDVVLVPLGRLVEVVGRDDGPSSGHGTANDILIGIDRRTGRFFVTIVGYNTLSQASRFLWNVTRLRPLPHVDAMLVAAALRESRVAQRAEQILTPSETRAAAVRAVLDIGVAIARRDRELLTAANDVRRLRALCNRSTVSTTRLRDGFAKGLVTGSRSIVRLVRSVEIARRDAMAAYTFALHIRANDVRTVYAPSGDEPAGKPVRRPVAP